MWVRAVAQCRVEAMLGAAYPTHDAATRATLFRGALRSALLAGRRPHAIFGDKEVARNANPRFLMPLLHATFDKYKPEEGHLTNPLDKETIEVLSRKARAKWPKLEVGYVPGFAYTGGAGSGEGKEVYDDGSVYVGQFKDDVGHGRGTFTYATGAVYEGEWQSGEKHGRGTFTFADGEADVVHFEAGQPVGEAARWSATREEAWRMQDGEEVAAISLEEAAEIAARIGLPVPS